MKTLILVLLAVFAVALPAQAAGPYCKKGTTKSAIINGTAAEIVTNTTVIRVCGVQLACGATCTGYMRDFTGGTMQAIVGLGAAGQDLIDYSGVSSGGWPGLELPLGGLYWDPMTGESTMRGMIFYELK